jgi:hypothetical protein
MPGFTEKSSKPAAPAVRARLSEWAPRERPSASPAAASTPRKTTRQLTSSVVHRNTPRTDPHVAHTLEGRLAQQAHWRQAPSVQRGEQSATDPDAYELEELQDGLRLYGIREQQRRTVEGRRVLVTQRLTKRLVDGQWATVYEVEHVRPA